MSVQTTTTAAFVIPAIGTPAALWVASNADFPVGSFVYLSDGTTRFGGVVSAPPVTVPPTPPSMTMILVQPVSFAAGAPGDTLASGATVTYFGASTTLEVVIDGDLWAPNLSPAAKDPLGNPLFVLPRIRDPKADLAVTLGVALAAVGYTNNLDGSTVLDDSRKVTLVKNGSFHQSLIRDQEYAGRSVINVGINGQQTERIGIGGAPGGLVGMGALINPGPTIPDPTAPPQPVFTGPAVQMGKKKTTTVEVDIFDLNMGEADALKDLVISLMDHVVENVMIAQLGYIEAIETSFSETTGVIEQGAGNPLFVYQRSLDYRVTWFSQAFKLPGLGKATQQKLTLLHPDLTPVVPTEEIATLL